MITAPTPSRSRPRAFTLIEVMVVIVILGILATLAVPRLTGNTRRHFDNTVDRVADLLIMYAQRDTLARNPVGLSYDTSTMTFTLTVLKTPDDDPDGLADWRLDPFVAPVELPDIVDPDSVIIISDNEPIDTSYWPLSHSPGEKRPEITITLQSRHGDYRSRLVLPSHAVAPRRIDVGGWRGSGISAADYASVRMPTDLDSAGRTREEW